ncbi:MAG: hypothetical protein L6V93_18205 [Clostridiales bacterium]|nr:MAG: hypothetical protein L6V93_18205 [Clostridiales bacterium]
MRILKIADGCDNHCTYCIIPKLRGKIPFARGKSIIAEAKALAQSGVKELIFSCAGHSLLRLRQRRLRACKSS